MLKSQDLLWPPSVASASLILTSPAFAAHQFPVSASSLPVMDGFMVSESHFYSSLYYPCSKPLSSSPIWPITNLGSVQTFSPSYSSAAPVLLSTAWESHYTRGLLPPRVIGFHSNLLPHPTLQLSQTLLVATKSSSHPWALSSGSWPQL